MSYRVCPNGCTDKQNQIIKLKKRELEIHLNQRCTRRQYTCTYCRGTGEYREMKTTHVEKCPGLKLICPFPMCFISLKRDRLRANKQVCLYEPINCKYALIGCKEVHRRVNIREHENKDELHLKITRETVLKQQIQIFSLKEFLDKRINTAPCSFKLANFETYKAQNVAFYSSPIYTSHSGYKLCLRICAKGSDEGLGSHACFCVQISYERR